MVGVTAMLAIRTRTVWAGLDTPVAVPFNTAWAVMSAVPRCMPLTTPVPETVALF